MKNFILASALSAVIISCKKNEQAVTDELTSDSVAVIRNDTADSPLPRISKNQDFLDKFETVVLDSTKFVAPNYDSKGMGKRLDSLEVALFPKELNYSHFSSDYSEFEAISKFDIDSNTIGLVARVPGEYSFTSVKLFFYNRTSDELLPKYFELADKLGDAGYTEELKSWLWKDGNALKSLSYLWTTVEPIEPDDRTRRSRTDDYYLIHLSPGKFDTVRLSKNDLSKYRNLLQSK